MMSLMEVTVALMDQQVNWLAAVNYMVHHCNHFTLIYYQGNSKN